MTKEELKAIDIHSWQDVKQKFESPDLLLGNGFSIAYCSDKFRYSNLYEYFLNNGIFSENVKKLFRVSNTCNFEQILKDLTYASKINGVLKLEQTKIEVAMEELRNGLIDAINEVHPQKKDVCVECRNLLNSISEFGDIFTTNYDLYLYWLIMEPENSNKHQDFFRGGKDSITRRNATFLKFNKREEPTKKIYYLHGALFLFEQGQTVSKLIRDNDDLLVNVTNQIENYNFPIFVAEGDSESKLRKIRTNKYLDFCFTKLNNTINNKPILIFGHSLSTQDQHIIDAIIESERVVIYALYCQDRTEESIQREKYRVLELFGADNTWVVDSSTIFEI